ncbi:hypothetical protein PoB_000130100 [Plakobranchus ocellatus]|uniref:Uncharacterized protein n=1 Tax=Plakobranchus ocellatus TaxID=259542 RepID=A0AAV3WYG8_9GAST|nr:hypothetical protein PoB_000130100 [Plakobranchus ocellatus]
MLLILCEEKPCLPTLASDSGMMSRWRRLGLFRDDYRHGPHSCGRAGGILEQRLCLRLTIFPLSDDKATLLQHNVFLALGQQCGAACTGP